ncbi:MAG: hypothetical protein V4724_13795 [Pseudomonadota bacterium]
MNTTFVPSDSTARGGSTPRSYRVITHGLRDGYTLEQVTAQLAALFKRTDAQMHTLLATPRAIIKKQVDFASALQFKEALERCGCACVIEPEVAAQPLPTALEHDEALPRWLARNKPRMAQAGVAPIAPASPPAAPASPYAAPAANLAATGSSETELTAMIAGGQKFIIYAIIANIALAMTRTQLPAALLLLGSLAILWLSFTGMLRMAKGMEIGGGLRALLVLLMLVPLINIIALVVLNSKGSKRLREAGYTIGLLGAKSPQA